MNKHAGQTAFGLHRISGIILVIYLFLHILLHSTALLFGKDAYNQLATGMDKPFVHLFELLIIIITALHLLNGIRLILFDTFPLTRFQKQLFFIVIFLTAFAGIYSLSAYFERIF